ncbi:MAG: AraC family transcriptional regulator [Bacteroidota bacterium]
MKPIYESILPGANASFKVQSYAAEDSCEAAGWHIHPEYEIVYVKNGAGVLKIGNKTHAYQNGVLVFLGGNIPHSDLGNYEKSNSLEVVVQFSKEFVNEKLCNFPELVGIIHLIEQSKQVLVFDNSIKSNLSERFERFSLLDNQGKLINLLDILNYLSVNKNRCTRLSSGVSNEFREKETYRLKKIFEHINKNYQEPIVLNDIAAKVGLTPNSFSRFFKKMTNRRFIDFVNEFKIIKAVEAMNQGSVTIKEIMHISGFNSPSYFAKQFMKYQQTTPSDYLKKIRSF